jgi:hypothetical protein
MAKHDRVDSVEAQEAFPGGPASGETAYKPEDMAAAAEQLHLIPPPMPDEMVQQILERQAVFGF